MCSVVSNGSLFKYQLVIDLVKPRPWPLDVMFKKSKQNMCYSHGFIIFKKYLPCSKRILLALSQNLTNINSFNPSVHIVGTAA